MNQMHGCGLWLWHSLDFSINFYGNDNMFCFIEMLIMPPSYRENPVQMSKKAISVNYFGALRTTNGWSFRFRVTTWGL